MARAAKKPSKSKKAPARSKAAGKVAARKPAKGAKAAKAAKPLAKKSTGRPVKAVSPKAGKKAVTRPSATKPPAAKAAVRKLAPISGKKPPGKAVEQTPVSSKKAPKAKPVEQTPVDSKKVPSEKGTEVAPVDPKKAAAAAKKVEVPAAKVAPEKPKKPRKPEVTPRDIAKIKERLEQERLEFSSEAVEIEEAAFNLSQSEMSGEVSFDEEYADAGSFTFEREKELSIGQNVRDLLEKVEHALAAIERGTYGLCENCGDPISKTRLLALPRSTLCLKCKQQEERTR